jgi:hypothetical protein
MGQHMKAAMAIRSFGVEPRSSSPILREATGAWD